MQAIIRLCLSCNVTQQKYVTQYKCTFIVRTCIAQDMTITWLFSKNTVCHSCFSTVMLQVWMISCWLLFCRSHATVMCQWLLQASATSIACSTRHCMSVVDFFAGASYKISRLPNTDVMS